MTKTPTVPSPQAPLAAGSGGAPSVVWFQFFAALVAYAASLESRIAALEEQP